MGSIPTEGTDVVYYPGCSVTVARDIWDVLVRVQISAARQAKRRRRVLSREGDEMPKPAGVVPDNEKRGLKTREKNKLF